MKRFLLLSLLMLIGASIIAQQVMNLGSTRFVKPSSYMTTEQRSIYIKTPVRGAFAFHKVGGIAFIQEATPADNFYFNNISLNCDMVEQTCFVSIDNKNYDIPLPTWMLQPIVRYANDTCNAVVTLYGEGDARILYHPAFVDKLLGLRLLQADMMFIKTEDGDLIPENEYGNPILANSEKMTYNSIDKKQQKKAIESLENVLTQYYGTWDTYIYTDRDQKIEFYVENGMFKISGEPYYIFAKRHLDDSSRLPICIDTVSFTETSRFFIDSCYKDIKKECEDWGYKEIIDLSQFSTNELITFYYNIDEFFEKYLKDTLTSSDEILSTYIASAFFTYVTLNTLPYTEERTAITNAIRNSNHIVKNTNPIVYDAAIATCQWSAFFRYMKKNNPANWKRFVQNVNKLKYDAPDIWTPIDYE